MIGESGGFLLDIRKGDKFVNTNLLTEMASLYHINGEKYTLYKEDSIPHRQLRKEKSIDVNMDLMLHVLCVMVKFVIFTLVEICIII